MHRLLRMMFVLTGFVVAGLVGLGAVIAVRLVGLDERYAELAFVVTFALMILGLDRLAE